jgi:biotin transport system substrate-specific component
VKVCVPSFESTKTNDRGKGLVQARRSKSSEQIRLTVYASLLAALTAAGAYLSIPIGPVPIVLQNLFVLLAGLLLGSRWGLASVSIYLLAGICGLPVFAGGLGGIGRILGPTGGYLVGYLPAVYVVGFISERTRQRAVFDLIAMVFGAAIVYVSGVTWLKLLTGMTLGKTLAIGVWPFLPGDALKIAAALAIVSALRPIVKT